jgi:CBS domain-containing protein
MKVREIMVQNVKSCQADNNLAQVAEIMWKGNCGALPVLDESGRLLSIITDRDICIALGTRNLRASDVHVSDVARPRYFACGAGDDIHAALKTMATQEIRRLPVVDDEGSLVGLLSIDDIVLRAKTGSQINFTEVINALKAIYRRDEHGPIAVAAAG